DGHAAVPAVSVLTRLGRRLGIELQVVGDEQVGGAVFVVVQKRAVGVVANAILLEPGAFGHVLKTLAAGVPVEVILAPVCHEEVGEAVIIEVGGANPLTPPGYAGEPHSDSDV